MLFQQMEEHLDKECPQTEIKCPFYVVGCTFEVCRKQLLKCSNILWNDLEISL